MAATKKTAKKTGSSPTQRGRTLDQQAIEFFRPLVVSVFAKIEKIDEMKDDIRAMEAEIDTTVQLVMSHYRYLEQIEAEIPEDIEGLDRVLEMGKHRSPQTRSARQQQTRRTRDTGKSAAVRSLLESWRNEAPPEFKLREAIDYCAEHSQYSEADIRQQVTQMISKMADEGLFERGEKRGYYAPLM